MHHFLHQLTIASKRARALSGARRHVYTVLSWVMLGFGCILVVALMFKTRAAFGLPMGRAPLQGLRLQFLGWIAVTAVSIPTLLYGGMVLVGTLFALPMLLLGRFTSSEARAFALFAQPPARWVESAA